MNAGPTIGILSPFLGGPYFGGVIAAVARQVRLDGGRVVAVQTLEGGSETADHPGPPDFHHRVAWDHLDGLIVVIEAVDDAYLDGFRATGRPVVVIGHRYQRVACPTVLADNTSGIEAAVGHLIGHGHTRIGFAGYLDAYDVRARFEAYRTTMLAHGLEPDPALCFPAYDNGERAGERAGGAVLDAGVPCTALVTGTDATAIGLIRRVTAAGCSVPEQLAVVGFDDMEDATYCIPSLSSVRQPFDRLGTAAYQLLAQLLRDGAAPGRQPEIHEVPTSFIARESCGCTRAQAAEPAAPPPATGRALAARLAALLDPGGLLADGHLLDEVADVITTVVEAAAAGVPVPVPARFHRALHGLYQRTGLRVDMEEIGEVVRGHAAAVAGDDPAARLAVARPVQEIIMKLAQARASGQYGTSAHYQAVLSTQYVVSMDLLRSHERDPRTLGWLARTPVLGGCLGLWPDQPPAPGADATVAVAGRYQRDVPAVAAGSDDGPLPLGAFPPADLLALADRAGECMVFVVPVRSAASDWGMLAVVATIDSAVPTGRETVSQWSALLTVALDHEAVLQSLREQEERLRRAALYDELTGLPNRALFVDRLRHSLRRARRRSDYHYAVLFLDIDGFKVVNDSLGHSAGDRLLLQVAQRITADLRDIDTAARFGGDEFLVLIEDLASLATPIEVAKRLQSSIARPFRLHGQDVVVTASIGIALGSTRYEDADEVLRDADIAMYTAKSRDRGTHAIFDVEMHARAVSRLQIEAELRQAIERHELEVHYQPIVDLRSSVASGFEALLRWRHPVRGLISPGEFLPVAEESGLMLPIGRLVLEESCQQLDRWRHAGVPADRLRMSVNVSNRQFWHGELMDDIDACLHEAHLEPERLALEITEGVIMHNVELACKMLGELHHRGVELHIDDFGTGYSSLEALHRLPIDALKIDRSFIARLGEDPRSGELVRTIVLMGGNLGMDVIAEGIETPAQSEHLRRLGTAYGQGFWFARPAHGQVAGTLVSTELPLRRGGAPTA